jgi:hypothetical protein
MMQMMTAYAMIKTIALAKLTRVGFAMVQERFMNADASIYLRNPFGAAVATFQKVTATATEINWMR